MGDGNGRGQCQSVTPWHLTLDFEQLEEGGMIRHNLVSWLVALR